MPMSFQIMLSLRVFTVRFTAKLGIDHTLQTTGKLEVAIASPCRALIATHLLRERSTRTPRENRMNTPILSWLSGWRGR